MTPAFRSRSFRFSRLATALLACAALHAMPAGAAPAIKPIPAADCTALQQAFTDILGQPPRLSTGRPAAGTAPAGIRGTACLLHFHGNAVKADYGTVAQALARHFRGWRRLQDIEASGPSSDLVGFAKGTRRVVYAIEAEAPAGRCEPAPGQEALPPCDLPAGQWIWTLDASAYDTAR